MNKITPRHWQAIFGNFEVHDGNILYRGRRIDDENVQESYPASGLLMSDVFFRGGVISAQVTFEQVIPVPSVQFVLYRNATDESVIRVGLEGGEIHDHPELGSYVVVIIDGTKPTDRYRIPMRSGFVKHPPSETFLLSVQNFGSAIDVFVNGVLIVRHLLTTPLPRSQCGLWCGSVGDVKITNYSVLGERKKAFVVMQFSEPFNEIYRDVLKPVVEAVGLVSERADDVAGPGLIIADIIRQIRQSEVVIADITPENQNVFYEIGYAHAIDKPTILLAEKGKKLPFDVSGMRVLFYENAISGKKQLEEGLYRHLISVVNG